jgi:putative peptidoglycan lipid II flippase
MFFALGIIAQSAGSAVFPTLSALAAQGDHAGFVSRLSVVVRGVLFLSFPAMIGLIVLGKPLVGLFQGGEWTETSTGAAAWALSFYAVGLAGFSLLEVLSRAFYALADTWTPVKIGMAAMVSNIVLSLIFIRFIGDPDSLINGAFGGLALANALTTLVEALALWWLLRRRLGGMGSRHILDGAARALAAALVMGAALYGLARWMDGAHPLVVLAAGGIIGGAVFFGLCLLLGLEEARHLPRMLLRRGRG